jgi:hypothetical protein
MADSKVCRCCKLAATEWTMVKKGGGAGGLDLYNCSPCVALNSRLKRIQDKSAVTEFRKQSAEKRAAFMAANHQTLGTHISKLLTESAIESVIERNTTAYSGEAEWLDNEDLKIRFKDKPEQLESLKNVARSTYDRMRGCMLTEVFSYKTKTNAENVHEDKCERLIEAETKIKPDKSALKRKVATPQASIENEAEVVEPTPLSALQRKKVEGALTRLRKLGSMLELESVYIKNEQVSDFLPKHLANKTQLQLAQLAMEESKLTMGLDNGVQCFKQVIVDEKTCREDTSKLIQTLKASLKIAIDEAGCEFVKGEDGIYTIESC